MADAEDAAAAHAAQAFINEVWGLQGAAYGVVLLRYISRIKFNGWSGLWWDDLIMFFAVLVHSAESVMAYLVVASWKGLANNGMTDEQRAALDPNSKEHLLRVNGSKTHVVGLLLYATLLWLLKGCWIVYYSRLTDGVNKIRPMIRIGIFMIPITYISCLLVAFFKCIPFNHQWQINPSPGNHCMPAVSVLQTIYVMVMNTITDFFLMAIPLPMILQSRLPLRQKFKLTIMFSGAFLEMAFGILRAVSILTRGDIDPAQSGYWSVRESFVSVVLTNLPIAFPLIKRWLHLGDTTANSGLSTGGSAHRLGSYPSRNARNTRSKTNKSVAEDAAWDSKERIVANGTTSGGQPAASGVSEGSDSSIELPRQKVDIKAQSRKANAAAEAQKQNQIYVTTEYKVEPAGTLRSQGDSSGRGGGFNDGF